MWFTIAVLVGVLSPSPKFYVYKSPRIDWLHGQHIAWRLPSNVSISLPSGNREIGCRYVEFTLSNNSPQRQAYGQFNFWSAERLRSLGLLRTTDSHRPVMLHEAKYVSCLLGAGHGYYLYTQFPSDSPKHDVALYRLFKGLSLAP